MSTIDEPVAQPAEAAKPRAFAASELVQCNACSRPNPPNRSTCLYCGTALEIKALNAFPATPLAAADANSETRFHVVACAPSEVEEDALDGIAESLKMKPAELEMLLGAASGAPIFAATSEQQARVAAAKLQEQDVSTQIISDEQLALDSSPQGILGLEIHGETVGGIARRGQKPVWSSWTDVMLIVVGRLYFATREIEQKRNRGKQLIGEREMLTDEAVLDIYPRHDAPGWRIRAGSFDFSCLGENRQLTAFANFATLTGLLRERSTTALIDDSYLRLRAALNSVWPVEPQAHAKERRRTALAEFDASVESFDNELQFTRYSRLLRYLHVSKSGDHAAKT